MKLVSNRGKVVKKGAIPYTNISVQPMTSNMLGYHEVLELKCGLLPVHLNWTGLELRRVKPKNRMAVASLSCHKVAYTAVGQSRMPFNLCLMH